MFIHRVLVSTFGRFVCSPPTLPVRGKDVEYADLLVADDGIN
jgi:hypothetical protein